MKNITKRLLASIIAAGTLLSVMPAFAEETAEPTVDAVTLADAEDAVLKDKYAEELALLNGLGILTDTNIKMTNSITRAEFLALVMKTIKMDSFVTEGEEIIFYDVLPSNEYYSIIMSAHKLGLVNGDDKGCFNPNSPIDAVAALKILVCALDYGFIAESRGGYPNGYINTARDMGLSDGIKVAGNADWRTAILMIDNALHSRASEISYTSDGKVTVGTGSETVLEKYYDVVRYSGIVEETNLTLRMRGDGYDDTALVIGGKLCNKIAISPAEGDALLGKKVVYYINEETNEIYSISVDSKYNTVTTVEPEDIKSASFTQLIYWDKNDKEIKLNIDKKASIYYNGCLSSDVTVEDMHPEDGIVTLIDNDNDRTAEVVIIEDWEDMVIASTPAEIVKSRYNDGKEIDLRNVDMVFMRDGFEITKSYLGEWDILKVMLSKNGKAGVAKVSSYKDSGKVEKVRTEKGETYITYGGEEHLAADIFVEAYTRRDSYAKTPTKGETYEFILDDKGVVYGISVVSTNVFQYGYLVKIASDSKLDTNYRAKLFGHMGSMKVYEVADNIKVNGRKHSDDLLSVVTNGQAVMYRINAKGELAELKTAVELPEGQSYDLDNFSLDKRISAGWSKSGNAMGGAQIINDGKTPMFFIPYDKDDDERYGWVTAYGNKGQWSNTYTKAYVYDIIPFEVGDGKYTYLSAIYLEETADGKGYDGISSDKEWQYIVTDVYETVLGDDEIVLAVETKGLNKGNTVTDYIRLDATNTDTYNSYGHRDAVPSDIQIGDVIDFQYENIYASQRIANRFIIYVGADEYEEYYSRAKFQKRNETDTWESYKESKTSAGASCYSYFFAEILYRSDTYLVVATADPDTGKAEMYDFNTIDGVAYEYSVSQGTVKQTNISAINPGDRVVMYGDWAWSTNPRFFVHIVE